MTIVIISGIAFLAMLVVIFAGDRKSNFESNTAKSYNGARYEVARTRREDRWG